MFINNGMSQSHSFRWVTFTHRNCKLLPHDDTPAETTKSFVPSLAKHRQTQARSVLPSSPADTDDYWESTKCLDLLGCVGWTPCCCRGCGETALLFHETPHRLHDTYLRVSQCQNISFQPLHSSFDNSTIEGTLRWSILWKQLKQTCFVMLYKGCCHRQQPKFMAGP